MKGKFFAIALMAVLALATVAMAVSPVYNMNFYPKTKNLAYVTSFFASDPTTALFVKPTSTDKVTYTVVKYGTTTYYKRATGSFNVMLGLPDKSTDQVYFSWNVPANDPSITVLVNTASKFQYTIDNVNILHRYRQYISGTGSTAVYEVTDEQLVGPIEITYYKTTKKMDIVGPGFSFIGVKNY